MANNLLQLNNDKMEMILIVSKTILNSDSVPQSINLKDCDIKFSNTVRNLGVCLDPTLSFQQQISSDCLSSLAYTAIWYFLGLVHYATICPKM